MKPVLSTITFTRPDKSVPFFYNKNVYNPKYSAITEEARRKGEILSVESKKSKDRLSLVTIVRYRSDADRKAYLERMKELTKERIEYCDTHGHTCEINHYL